MKTMITFAIVIASIIADAMFVRFVFMIAFIYVIAFIIDAINTTNEMM